jgi:transposase
MAKEFRESSIDQIFLLPPDIRDWLPADHRAWFIGQIVDALDINKIEKSYASQTGSGPRAYAPRTMLKILIYGYSVGVRSSRKLEIATHEQVPFRVLSAGQHPDHDTIARFRRENLKSVEDLFLQVLGLCKKAGIVKIGRLVLDGTKVKASANKTKSRTYAQLMESEAELKKQIQEALNEAEQIDQAEDKQYGEGKNDEYLPEALSTDEKRLKIIQELKKKIEVEAEIEKEKVKAEVKKRREEDQRWQEEHGEKFEGRYPQEPGVGKKPLIAESRRNPTDFDSRHMKDGQTGGFIQGYNCQAVVDEGQVIVAIQVTNQNNDKALASVMMEEVKKNIGVLPEKLTADSGYFSERELVRLEPIDSYIPPLERDKGKRLIPTNDGKKITMTEAMKIKLQTPEAKALYKRRKCIVEPVFGQIKEAQMFRSFLLRGIEKVTVEWNLVAMCHNLNKLFRAQSAEVKEGSSIFFKNGTAFLYRFLFLYRFSL